MYDALYRNLRPWSVIANESSSWEQNRTRRIGN